MNHHVPTFSTVTIQCDPVGNEKNSEDSTRQVEMSTINLLIGEGLVNSVTTASKNLAGNVLFSSLGIFLYRRL